MWFINGRYIQWKLVNTKSLNKKYCLTRTLSVNQLYIQSTIFILLTSTYVILLTRTKFKCTLGFLLTSFHCIPIDVYTYVMCTYLCKHIHCIHTYRRAGNFRSINFHKSELTLYRANHDNALFASTEIA